VAAGAESIGQQFRTTGDARHDASPTNADMRIRKRPAAGRQNPLIQINAKWAAPPNMAAGNSPDAVDFPNILK
jgi:hypothetical protein